MEFLDGLMTHGQSGGKSKLLQARGRIRHITASRQLPTVPSLKFHVDSRTMQNAAHPLQE
jgi:ribosome-binding factor A